MKIAGIDPNSLSREILLVLPRGESQIVFRAKGLKDMSEFTAICPLPKPPGKLTKDGFIPNNNDPTYQQVLTQWSTKRLGFMVIKTLEPTEIEWDTVDIANPATWGELGKRPEERWPQPVRVQPCDRPRAGSQQPRRRQDRKGSRGFSCWSGAGSRKLLWPSDRTGEYTVWGACERLGILPPGVQPAWDDCGTEAQALIIAYHQTRSYDESERDAAMAGARMP